MPKSSKNKNQSTLKKIFELIKVIAPIATVLALIMSIAQLRDASEFGSNLNKISNSVSTQFINTFPNNMTAINKLIEGTKSELDIVVDFVAYGHFSNPSDFLKYESYLKVKAAEKVKIRIMCYDSAKANWAREKQFGDNLDEIKKLPSKLKLHKGKTAYDVFLDYHHKYKDGCELKMPNDFFKALEKENNYLKEKLEHLNVEIKYYEKGALDKFLPMFIWLSDGREAIISFYNYDSDPMEVSFKTHDTDLINYIKIMVESYFKRASSSQGSEEFKRPPFPKE